MKFYNKNVILEEGIWELEFWIGTYKKYYSNGIIEIIGGYSNEEGAFGNKIGKWKYYSSTGILEYEEEYEDGKLLKYSEP
ncbi:MAG: hypothetical protein COB15_11590 [Flavobacteriales bacterium]|nr:MAG: hypothetical protein COB15_11590 [Flavobacteriales bacterium]